MLLPLENIKKILAIYIAVAYLNVLYKTQKKSQLVPARLYHEAPLDVFINDAPISSTNFTLNIVNEASDHYHIIIT